MGRPDLKSISINRSDLYPEKLQTSFLIVKELLDSQ